MSVTETLKLNRTKINVYLIETIKSKLKKKNELTIISHSSSFRAMILKCFFFIILIYYRVGTVT